MRGHAVLRVRPAVLTRCFASGATALALLTGVGIADPVDASAFPRVGIGYQVDGRVHSVDVAGRIKAGRSSGKRVTVVLQGKRVHGNARWRNRAHRVLRLRRKQTAFALRWAAPPPKRVLRIRVVVVRHGRVVGVSGAKRVLAGDPPTVYYSGVDTAGAREAKYATLRLVEDRPLFGNSYDGTWTAGDSNSCDWSKAASFPPVVRGKTIGGLAGYSLGRLGPIYFLKAAPSRRPEISYILLLDPGGSSDLAGSCDADSRIAPWRLLNDWLNQRASNRLVIMAGEKTMEGRNPKTAPHTAIRAFYLRNMSNATIRNQVLVCSAPIAHDDFMKEPGGYGWMVGGEPPFSCPIDSTRYEPPRKREPAPDKPHPRPAPVVTPSAAAIHLAQGPLAPSGSWYAASLTRFAPDSDVSVTCHDSIDPSGFTTFVVHTDTSGRAFSQSGCYSGDGPDHWVTASGTESNHVAWNAVAPPPPTQLPPSPPVTYAETTGGVTHTWTNYTNAGGYEGPTIPAYTTVQIACKLTGFRVADGNTWWYRIASSPWDGNYYASADAFYNNGQTSGSLIGTPFVDWNVRDC